MNHALSDLRSKSDEADVTVVISTYNRPKALNLVLEGLFYQQIRARQIIVGDDGSTDETREVINGWRSRGLPVEHCWHEDRGYRKSVIMNQAIRMGPHCSPNHRSLPQGDRIVLSRGIRVILAL